MIAHDWIRNLTLALTLATLLLATTACSNAPVPHSQYWVYVGNNDTAGIALLKLDTAKATLTPAGMASPPAPKPGFFAISPNQKFLYAGVTNTLPSGPAGEIDGYSINAATGQLSFINSQPTQGDEPCFVSVDPAGKNVLNANYNSAVVSILPIDADGNLSPATTVIHETGSSINPERQTHAYAHSVNVDPTGRFAISCDLGADKLFIYKLDAANGKLTPNDPPSASVPPGSGPRHLIFHPNGKFVYAITEMGGTVVAFHWDSKLGALTQFQVAKTLKNDEKGNTSAEVQIDPAGKFLYASNRLTTNYLTIFSIDQTTGELTLVGYQDALGKTPRNFRIEPTGHFMVLANQDSNTLVLFSINKETGKLTPVGNPIPTIKTPICIKFIPVAGN